VLYLGRWVEAGIAETVVSANALGLGIAADVNARAAQWAGQYAAEMARGITATTMELVRAKIKQNIIAGGSLADLNAALAEIVAPKWRASMIAQTEITRAYAMANQEIAKELGIEKGLYWNTRRDERVCPFCFPNDGKPVSRVGSPPAHPRCRCGTTIVL
jgi:SPP1 gp7 family putative phage head morphogenesis protein